MTSRKVLVIGPSWVGDLVMSQSLYIRLKELDQNIEIDVLAPKWCQPLLARMPEVSKSIEMPVGHGELKLKERWQLARYLAKYQYDQAYILPKSIKSALIPWLAGIKKRTGWKGEMRYGLINDLRSNMNSFQYMVERYVALGYRANEMTNSTALGGLSCIPQPKLFIDEVEQKNTLNRFNINTSHNLIGLCPGAEFGPAKKWPEKHYSTVAEELCKQGAHICLFGSQKDIETCDNIKKNIASDFHSQVHLLAGRTSLTEAVDLLAACDITISNDSGLMHVAAAVGSKVIAIYGSTSPEYTPPLGQDIQIIQENIECQPCFKRECPLNHLDCLNKLLPNKVLTKLDLNKIK